MKIIRISNLVIPIVLCILLFLNIPNLGISFLIGYSQIYVFSVIAIVALHILFGFTFPSSNLNNKLWLTSLFSVPLVYEIYIKINNLIGISFHAGYLAATDQYTELEMQTLKDSEFLVLSLLITLILLILMSALNFYKANSKKQISELESDY